MLTGTDRFLKVLHPRICKQKQKQTGIERYSQGKTRTNRYTHTLEVYICTYGYIETQTGADRYIDGR